ncbi:MAG: alpha/beta hydrolase [Nitrososphaera sp.]|jgi:pimeloyl-ACP methyl ester carboxylesterase
MAETYLVSVNAGNVELEGDLVIPSRARGLVLFAHGSGSSRHSPRNRYVARVLHDAGIGTLLIDLLTLDEERIDAYTMHLRFDIPLLAKRLVGALMWLSDHHPKLGIGLFGASTGAAAALVAAARLPQIVRAIVSRGGRPDLAGAAFLHSVMAPTLLIVGGEDSDVIALNEQALELMKNAKEKKLVIVPGATHLFEEPGKLEEVSSLACVWFSEHIA